MAQIGCAGLALLGVSCGGGEQARLALRFLYAANPDDRPAPAHPWEGYGCAAEQVEGGDCVAVRLSACNPGTGECQPLLDGPAEGQDDPVVELQGGTFDLKTKTATRADLFLQVGMYDRAGDLVATGESRGIRFTDGQAAGVTLFGVGGRTSCPRPSGAAVEGLSRRAFHTATLLPNGEVLVVGGVSGPTVQEGGSPLEENVESLDPREGVARHLGVDDQADGEAGSQLLRAFHQAAYLGVEADGRYRVRLFGGIRATSGQPVATVSRDRADTPLQLLVAATASAEPAPPVDLLYDVAARRVTVVSVTDGDAVPRASFGGLAVESDVLGAETMPEAPRTGFLVGGGLGSWTARQLQVDQVAPVLATFEAGADGATADPSPPPLRVGRVGATAIPVGSGSVLFWGGNAWSAEGIDVTADADAAIAAQIGELHAPGGDTPSWVAPSGLAVRSTAFHAAAVAAIDADGTRRVVVAGGYVLSAIGTVDVNLFSPEPLYLLSVDGREGTATTSAITCQEADGRALDCREAFGDVAYATATWVTDGVVFVAGGNFRYAHDATRSTGHGARAAAGVVTVDGDAAVFEPVDLAEARYGHSATRLSDGSVLILGGLTLECDRIAEDGTCEQFGALSTLATYEIFNPGLALARTAQCEPAS